MRYFFALHLYPILYISRPQGQIYDHHSTPGHLHLATNHICIASHGRLIERSERTWNSGIVLRIHGTGFTAVGLFLMAFEVNDHLSNASQYSQ